jgi:ribosomal protein S18 acetylase RimI-like enzyme
MPDTAEQEVLPVRSSRKHLRCLNRTHRFAVGGVNSGYHHGLRLSTESCNLCRSLHQPRYKWLVVEHTTPLAVDRADQPEDRRAEILVVARRPPVQAGVGQLEVRVRGDVVAVTDVQLCAVEHRAVLRSLWVDPGWLRRGFGTLLLDAAQARGPDYEWSTTALNDATEAQAFWASQDTAGPLDLGKPNYCTHMREANGELG